MTLHARFAIDHPGTDIVWQGTRKVTGRLTLHGFRGFRRGKSHARADVELDQKLSVATRDAVVSTVLGRLSMWGNCEFCGRGSFASVFANHTITKDGATGKRFKIEGPGLLLRVGLRGDLPAWIETAGGGRREFTYKKLRDRWVATSSAMGKSRVTATWKAFERVLGDSWGPETIALREVRMSPSPSRR